MRTVVILLGIDEAGYGPLLGPLTVAGVAFRVPDDRADACLWRILADSITRSVRRTDIRLPIVDSKKLYSRQDGLMALERTALVMLKTAGRQPASFKSLLKVVAPKMVGDLDAYPWYARFDPALPLATSAADIGTRANAVRRDMDQQGVELIAVHADVVCEGHFNRLVEATRNKSILPLQSGMRIIQRMLERGEGVALSVCVDRNGGRERYADKLMTFFEGSSLRIREETPQRSAYELKTELGAFSIEFVVKAEERSLPVALASVFAKYVREAMMRGLNAYFLEYLPTLAPTAGYYTDAQRFLEAIAPVIVRERLDRAMLVRSR